MCTCLSCLCIRLSSFCVCVYLLYTEARLVCVLYPKSHCLKNCAGYKVAVLRATCKYSSSRDIWLVFFPPTIYAAHTRPNCVTSPCSNSTYFTSHVFTLDPCSCDTEPENMHTRKSTECNNALCVHSMYFTSVPATLCTQVPAWLSYEEMKILEGSGSRFSPAHTSEAACVTINLANQKM